ncbi:hypothetical protein EDB81DRAFT_859313 [Dactylonectria macrodidyma]|uniref:SRR1-like domain-containing protein n=1 Tax=Dactylonectria macrodidyma TaxID=307937 RepID=A0A9P9IVG7_9HYPO|nr:hypothetical protein EDB81DRAFT_859313 [Dactylonectria macrodidyma]
MSESSRPSSGDGWPFPEKEDEERAKVTDKVWKLYNAGIPLFTMALLKDVEAQLASQAETIFIEGIDGVRYPQYTTPRGADLQGKIPHISFNDIQRFVDRPPGTPVSPNSAYCSLAIRYSSPDTRQVKDTEEDAIAVLKEHWQIWEESDACRQLKETLNSVPIPESITKVVCFALGSLVPIGDWPERSYTQHAAALTMVDVLKARTGCDIQCYAQEPIYTDICRKILGSHGIKVLDGVKGFLEVDETTLVFSVSPNIPVKQIITDLARPAIMVWNRVRPEKPGKTEWTKQRYGSDGGFMWMSPHSTDPDSPRVRDMVEKEYLRLPFPNDQERMGDLEIYVRKE